jgi:hypothetical protein
MTAPVTIGIFGQLKALNHSLQAFLVRGLPTSSPPLTLGPFLPWLLPKTQKQITAVFFLPSSAFIWPSLVFTCALTLWPAQKKR